MIKAGLLFLCTVAQAAGALPENSWSQMLRERDHHRRQAVADASGFQARNPGQQWLARFDGRGFTVQPDGADWTWGLELTRFGAAGSERRVSGRASVSAQGDTVTYAWPNGVREWFINGTAGLEHGFTIHDRPAGPGLLRVTLAVRGGLRPSVERGERAHFSAANGPVVSYSKLKAWDADGTELPARMQTEEGSLVLAVDAATARFPVTIDPVAQQAYLKASNAAAGDNFGAAVAISGNTAVVGAPLEDGNGTSPADNTATDSGAAYVFVKSGSTWTQQAYLKPASPAAGDNFGWSVAISGDTIVVGSPNRGGMGAAYVFVRSGSTWTQQAMLEASNKGALDNFGWAAAVSGDTAVIGAPFEDSNGTGVNSATQADNSSNGSGAAYVFTRSGTAWSQQAYLKASNTGANDNFGRAAAINADTVLIGSPLEDSNGAGINGAAQADNSSADSGAVYIFKRSGTTWTQEAYAKASNTGAGDAFGWALGIDSNTAIVGAPGESSSGIGVNANTQADDSAFQAGAAYVFTRSGTVWTQQAYVKASNTTTPPPNGFGDLFGYAVGISGNLAIVGAPEEDSNGTGVNSPAQDDNSAADAGAAYLFVRSGGVWSQASYLKATNTGASDIAGVSVAISLDNAIVGATQEDSAATSINGNGADNSATDAGAAYAFSASIPFFAASGSGQSASINTAFALPLQVTVTDPAGNPVFGAPVSFTVPGSGASAQLSSGTSITNAQGVASVTATANGTAGTYTVVANIPGDPTSATLTLTNVAAGAPVAPTLISPANGSNTSATIINFQWSNVANATSYEFRLREASWTQIFRVTLGAGSTNTIYTFPSGSYRWEMEACNAIGCSPTAVSNFTIAAGPVPPTAPTNLGCTVVNDTNQNRLNCNWTAAPGAHFHFINVVQPGAGPGGGALTVAGGQVGGTSISILIPNGSANVLVRGCTGDGCGPFTAAFPITPAFGNPVVPILGEPFGGSTVDKGASAPDITFTWNRVAGDNGSNFTYRLYVQDFSRNRAAVDVLTTANFYGAFVNPGTRYDALVIAIPKDGSPQRQGPASPFLVRGAVPNAPVATEPTFGSTVTRNGLGQVHVAWTPLVNADGTVSTRNYQYYFNTPSPVTGVTTSNALDAVFPVGTFQGIMRACTIGTACVATSDNGWGPWNNAPGSQGGQGLFTVQ